MRHVATLTAALALIACAFTETAPASDVAAALDKALAGSHRSEANRARDVYRHPKETLTFFGLRDDMTVVEIWPGGGWYTEVLAPVLKDKGKLYAAHLVVPASGEVPNSLKSYREKLAGNTDLYGKVEVTALGPESFDIAPAGSVDMVLTFRNIHNWMARDYAPKVFAAVFRALKPGGTFGVVEHRADPAQPADPKAQKGYVNEEAAIKMIEAAGFRLVAKSDVNNNSKDTKDYEQGVWTLPPNLRAGDKDREKYLAIGESDRFTLKFQKPKS